MKITGMKTKNFTRVLIETAVDRGIRDVTDDPKRSLRRLADMGKQFSEGRFQKASFGHITNLLKNDESPYYQMLEDFLASVDHHAIKSFGLNMGYDSWTYGARLIRNESEKRGYMLPWVVLIHYDNEKEGSLKASDINGLVERLQPLGVNTYVIIKERGLAYDPKLTDVVKAHPTCAFFLFFNDAQIPIAEAGKLKELGNAVISVNIAAEDAMATCRALKEIKALYVIHYIYEASEIGHFSDDDCIEDWLSYGSAFIFLVQKENDKGVAGKLARKARMEQEYPILIWDVYSDIRLVNEMISDMPFIFEISYDGSVRYPEASGRNILDTDVMDILKEIAPPYRPIPET